MGDYYRKKPVVIRAWQFTRDNYRDGLPIWLLKHMGDKVDLWPPPATVHMGGEIQTLEGVHTVTENDWIIEGVQGELYPCKPDIFKATYEEA